MRGCVSDASKFMRQLKLECSPVQYKIIVKALKHYNQNARGCDNAVVQLNKTVQQVLQAKPLLVVEFNKWHKSNHRIELSDIVRSLATKVGRLESERHKLWSFVNDVERALGRTLTHESSGIEERTRAVAELSGLPALELHRALVYFKK
jgi:hypothetical protein